MIPRWKRPDVTERLRTTQFSERNPMWKGNNVSYKALHAWVRKYLPKPQNCKCERCDNQCYDIANISIESNAIERYSIRDPKILVTYNKDFSNWLWLCRSCHIQYDGRIKNLDTTGKKLSDEHKEKIRISSIGRKRSEESKRKSALAQTGKHVGPTVNIKGWETRRKNGKDIGSLNTLKGWETRRRKLGNDAGRLAMLKAWEKRRKNK